MSRKILTPTTENAVTKFYFGKQIESHTFEKLHLEFFNEDYETSTFKPGIDLYEKGINKKEKKTIELTSEYILFFPAISGEKEIEDVRKRIFRHVAKRYEVYNLTSQEDLSISISSLIHNDLRACVSLLYYSFHKFTNSIMYYYFNTALNKTDHDIFFDEIEHYTSFMFYKFSLAYEGKGKININDDSVVLEEVFSHHNAKQKIDPFMLLRYALKKNNYYSLLLPYIKYISKSLFEVNFETESQPFYESKYTEIMEELKGNKDQEKEVIAAILYCFKESFKESKYKDIWLIYIVALRLYWLRQTADYEFDFDVKTSVKEMSKLVHTVKSIIETTKENIEEEEIEQSIDKIQKWGKIPNIPDKDEEQLNLDGDTKETFSIDCPLYSVEFSFPEELLFDEDVNRTSLYMTVLHLDSEFDFEKIVAAINFTPNITNRNDYFIYETTSFVNSIYLYLTLEQDGRWIFWFKYSNKNSFLNSHSQQDLKEAFKEFFTSLAESYKDFHNTSLVTNLVGSKPLYYTEPLSMLKSRDLVFLQEELEKRRYSIQREIYENLKKFFIINDDKQLSIGNLILDLNIRFGLSEVGINIPNKKIYLHALERNENSVFQINIIIKDFDHSFGRIFSLRNPSGELLKRLNLKYYSSYYVINSDEITNLITTGELSKLCEFIIASVNNMSYADIEEEENLLDTKSILEECIRVFPSFSLPYATLGYWYFINGEMSEAEEKGIDYYSKALEVEKINNNGEYESELHQKYYLELARFYCKRLGDIEKALPLISKGLDKHDRFRKDYIELIKEFKIKLLTETEAIEMTAVAQPEKEIIESAEKEKFSQQNKEMDKKI